MKNKPWSNLILQHKMNMIAMYHDSFGMSAEQANDYLFHVRANEQEALEVFKERGIIGVIDNAAV